MMYMRVMFSSRSRGVITRSEVVELPDDIKNKGLSSEQITACDEKAKKICRRGERVLGWKLLEEYELDKLKKKLASLNEPWYNSPLLICNSPEDEEEE